MFFLCSKDPDGVLVKMMIIYKDESDSGVDLDDLYQSSAVMAQVDTSFTRVFGFSVRVKRGSVIFHDVERRE